MATEHFEKVNDYTLMVTTDLQNYSGEKTRRIFNFAARQVTELYNAQVSHGVSAAMAIQKFSDLDSTGEVQLMHKKLVEQGGTPPAIDDLLNEPAKPALKSATLRP